MCNRLQLAPQLISYVDTTFLDPITICYVDLMWAIAKTSRFAHVCFYIPFCAWFGGRLKCTAFATFYGFADADWSFEL